MKSFRYIFATFAAAALLALPAVSFATVYGITFKLNNAGSYDSVDFRVNYSAANGDFVGSGDTVQCTTNASLNATASYNDADPSLNAGIIKTTTFQAPVALVTCNFDAVAGAPTANQFVITVRDWTPSASPSPSIIISQIQ